MARLQFTRDLEAFFLAPLHLSWKDFRMKPVRLRIKSPLAAESPSHWSEAEQVREGVMPLAALDLIVVDPSAQLTSIFHFLKPAMLPALQLALQTNRFFPGFSQLQEPFSSGFAATASFFQFSHFPAKAAESKRVEKGCIKREKRSGNRGEIQI